MPIHNILTNISISHNLLRDNVRKYTAKKRAYKILPAVVVNSYSQIEYIMNNIRNKYSFYKFKLRTFNIWILPGYALLNPY